MSRPRIPIEIGSMLGNWTILSEEPDQYEMVNGRNKAIRMVKAQCSCGATVVYRYHTLKMEWGRPNRGCVACKNRKQVIDLTGRRFGKIQVLNFESFGNMGHSARWRCLCDCGTNFVVSAQSLLHIGTTSCGCLVTRRGANHPKWKGCGDISSSQWSHTKRAAEVRDIAFNITIEEAWGLYLKQDGKCALTGVPIHLRRHRMESPTASLDRIDSQKAYQLDNVQWLHKRVNLVKRDLPQLDFIALCHSVAAHNHNLATDVIWHTG